MSTANRSPPPPPSRRPPYDDNPSKRQRRACMAPERASSSSDSASVDHDTEPERVPPSDAQQTAAPPKKKRTRTLTTPHQSAVLHALLAKSRFPTTAMREEVGRQIGLSARKVQIWFQNQRQKARRPQTDSAPLTRPPQFGPFPIMTPPGPSPSSSSYPPLSAGSASEHSLSARSAVHDSGGSLDSNPPLSGPGMPGHPSSSHPSADERDPPPRGVPTSPPIPLVLPPRPSESKPPGTHGPFMPSLPPSAPSPASPIETSPHFSRVLPPIHLAALRARSSTEPNLSVSTVSPAFPPPPPPPPSLLTGANAPPRTSVTIVQRHDASPSGTPSPGAFGIPPPFALQPKPQWDPQTFAPYTRPEFASWSHTGGSSRVRTAYHTSPDGTGRRSYEPRESLINSPSRGHRHPSTSTTCRATHDAGGA